MKRIMVCVLVVSAAITSFAQYEDPETFAATITQEDLEEYLSILASDALEGRDTGKRGQKMAAAFLRQHYIENELQPPVPDGDDNIFLQSIDLSKSSTGEVWVKSEDQEYKNFSGIVYSGNENMEAPRSLEVVFAGTGEESDYEHVDVTDKAVVIMATEGGIMRMRGKTRLASQKGAAVSFVIVTESDEEFDQLVQQYKNYFSGSRLSLRTGESRQRRTSGNFLVSPTVAAALLDSEFEDLTHSVERVAEGKKANYKKFSGKITYLATRQEEVVKSENVLAYLEGTDKKDELLVITSHYDHVGKRGDDIYNGADDDGSGTVAVMEIAQAFAEAKKAGKGPRRSILFMNVTGEEKGLLGSEYYVNNPVFPLENTIANLNIDMIGRVDPEHEEDPNYVYLIGSDKLSSELHELSELANEKYTQVELDYTYNDENDPNRFYYRSDHYNFAKNNIPIIFYFNGTHEDYHQPTDTVDKIHFEMLQKRAQLVFFTAWALANREDRIIVDKIKDTEIDGQGE